MLEGTAGETFYIHIFSNSPETFALWLCKNKGRSETIKILCIILISFNNENCITNYTIIYLVLIATKKSAANTL